MDDMPLSRDAYTSPDIAYTAATALTIAGAHEQALTALALGLRQPATGKGPFTRLYPIFAPLRNHPRFQQLVAK